MFSILIKGIVGLAIISVALFAGVAIASIYTFYTRPTPVYPRNRIDKISDESLLRRSLEKENKKPIVIITGSTAGIGEGLAKEFFRLGYHVILASRSESKLKEVAAAIQKLFPNSHGSIDYGVLELSDLDSVRNFANWYKGKYSYLNYLVNNAGMHYMDGHTIFDSNSNITTKQGYDKVFATNFLGHFLLTYYLLPMISEGRIVNASSSYHFQADGSTLRVKNGNAPDASNGINRDLGHKRRAYSVTKLANVLHANEVQRRLKAEGREKNVQALAFCPGWVATGMVPQAFIFGKIIYQSAFSVETGIYSAISCVLEPVLHGGEFVCNCRPPIFTRPIGKKILALLTKLRLRDNLLDIYAFFLSIVQNSTYGFNVFPCSVEGQDERLARDLYDWSEKELKTKGYITNQ